jgi:hypothetical protein
VIVGCFGDTEPALSRRAGSRGHLASLHWPALLGACLRSIHLGAADADRRDRPLPAPAGLAGDPAAGPLGYSLEFTSGA